MLVVETTPGVRKFFSGVLLIIVHPSSSLAPYRYLVTFKFSELDDSLMSV